VLCSFVLDLTIVVTKDQAINGVGVAQPTCFVIHEEYDWEPEHQLAKKDDPLMFAPPPLFPNIFDDSVIPDFSCVSPSMDAPIVDCSQNMLDVNPSFNSGDWKNHLLNIHLVFIYFFQKHRG